MNINQFKFIGNYLRGTFCGYIYLLEKLKVYIRHLIVYLLIDYYNFI